MYSWLKRCRDSAARGEKWSLPAGAWSLCPDMKVCWSTEMLSTAPNLLLLSFITLSVLSHVTEAKKDLKSTCSTCKQISENFEKVRKLHDHTNMLLLVWCLVCFFKAVSDLSWAHQFFSWSFLLSWFQGFDRTAKQNFGGGNTAWEERKLSKYETR